MQADAARRQLGRPRDARADRAILNTTLELIAEHGVHGFRTEDVAARAGVGKGAIYRRYRSKDELVTAAVATLVGEEIALPDTGSTRGDLLVLMREAVALYRSSLPARLMPNLVGAMAEQPELARAVRKGFLAGRRAALSEVLRRGVEPATCALTSTSSSRSTCSAGRSSTGCSSPAARSTINWPRVSPT